MTSVGASRRASRSCRGSMAPCPAPRRLAARPAGRFRNRSERSRAARADGSAGLTFEDGLALPLVDERGDPVALEPGCAGLVGCARGGAPRRSAMPADGLSSTSRRIDAGGSPPAGARCGRRASSRARAPGARPPRAGSLRDRRPSAPRWRRPAPPGCRSARGRAGRRRRRETAARTPSRCPPQLDSSAREAVEQQQWDARCRGSGPPTRGHRRRRRSCHRASTSATTAAASRWSSTLRRALRPNSRTWTPGRPIESASASRTADGPTDR